MQNIQQKTERQFSLLLFASGIFNIVLAAPLAIPGFASYYFEFLWRINQMLGLGGKQPIAPTEGINSLLVNTAGIDLVLVGAIVFYAGFSPLKLKFIPWANAIGRTIFAGVIIYYIFAFDIMQLVLVIGALDLMISAGFIYFLLRLRFLDTSSK